MATKDLARTAVEGGRYDEYKRERDRIKRSRRSKEREHAQRAKLDPEAVMPKTGKISKRGYQTENLSPIYRFLDSHVGHNWDKVYALIKERFDTRTIQAYHIVINHIIGEVASRKEVTEIQWQWARYYRDNQNRLQKTKLVGPSLAKQRVERGKKILLWLNYRVVGQVGIDGNGLFWFEPTRKVRLEWNKGPVFYEGRHIIEPHFRQGRRLTEDEVRYFCRLQEWERAAICKHSPHRYTGIDYIPLGLRY